jgi:hypothetical protein
MHTDVAHGLADHATQHPKSHFLVAWDNAGHPLNLRQLLCNAVSMQSAQALYSRYGTFNGLARLTNLPLESDRLFNDTS